MHPKKIFCSYSRTDASDFTLKLAIDLKKEGYNVWIDQRDIRAGTEWDLEIEKALETCDCLLFIESENSVVSNNVLDEVYYALEQRKRVIPVIYHDSKTPFRLQRLQHIDFTKNYETGLSNLVYELKRDPSELSQPPEGNRATIPAKPFYKRYSGLVIFSGILLIIVIAAIIFSINLKPAIDNPIDKTINREDTLKDQQPVKNIDTKEPSTKVDPENKITNEKKMIAKNTVKPVDKPNNRTDNKITTNPENTIENLHETFAGNWELTAVEPKAASQRGYLRIEEIDEKKVKIQSNFQFYFFKTNDTAYFVVFNGFAACSSCVLKNEMQITDKDIAFGTNKYGILRKDQPGEGKAGDTISTTGGNSSISALVTLQLLNNNTIVIKVSKSVPTPISNGFVVKPFEYSFRFRKSD